MTSVLRAAALLQACVSPRLIAARRPRSGSHRALRLPGNRARIRPRRCSRGTARRHGRCCQYDPSSHRPQLRHGVPTGPRVVATSVTQKRSRPIRTRAPTRRRSSTPRLMPRLLPNRRCSRSRRHAPARVRLSIDHPSHVVIPGGCPPARPTASVELAFSTRTVHAYGQLPPSVG